MKINEEVLNATAQQCKELGVVIPTFAQMNDPSLLPEPVRERLRATGLMDVDPINLFRITWKNEPMMQGGLFNGGNWIEFPSSLTGVEARIIGMVGRWFPTGAHKVGAGFGCLVPRLVTGQLIHRRKRRCGPRRGTIAGAVRLIVRCSAVRRSGFCRRR